MLYGGNYVYMYQNNRLVRFDGYMTQNYTDKNGRSCSDDILDIKSDRSDTAWTDPSTGIRYKLKFWGFVNNGSSDSCQAQLSTAESAGLEERFITRERSISYGCLYGSLEQERPVTFAKDIKADASVHGSLTIPQFSYLNASPEGTYGHENWGTPSGLTPTWSGEAVDPRTYTLLAPHDAATVQEAGTSPQAVVDRDTGDVRTSGWFLRNVTCTAGSRGTPLLRRDGTTRLDQSDSVNLDKRTIRLDETQLAEHQDEVAVKCVWHNEYVVGRGRVTLVTVVDGGSAKPNQWTMTATPATEGLFGQKTFTTAGRGVVEISYLRANDYVNGVAKPVNQLTDEDYYCLVETKAPEGYTLQADPIPFRVLAEKATAKAPTEMTVTDVPKNASFRLPLTGANDVIFLTVAGALLVVGGAVVAYANKRRHAAKH